MEAGPAAIQHRGPAGTAFEPRESLIVVFSLLRPILARSKTRRPPARELPVQRRLTFAEITALLAARHDGVTVDGLARRFGVHRTTVLAHLKREDRSRIGSARKGNPPTR